MQVAPADAELRRNALDRPRLPWGRARSGHDNSGGDEVPGAPQRRAGLAAAVPRVVAGLAALAGAVAGAVGVGQAVEEDDVGAAGEAARARRPAVDVRRVDAVEEGRVGLRIAALEGEPAFLRGGVGHSHRFWYLGTRPRAWLGQQSDEK